MSPPADPVAAATRTLSRTLSLSRTSTSRSLPAKGALEYGYPHGHLGHLTASEEAALADFKVLLAQHSLYTPAPPSHDDATLLRYLRARRWDLPAAHAQFRDTEAWRAAIGLDALYDSADVDAYEATRRLYPQWTGRRDRRGIPVYLFEIRHLDTKTIAKAEKVAAAANKSSSSSSNPKDKMGNLFALYENLTRFTQPLCSQLTDREHAGRTPITLSTNIVDVTGVSLRGYWNLKTHMQAASELATAHYPETLDRIFIIGAPAFFTTVWSWVKRWFDPVTVSKIFVLSAAETLPTLKSFIDIENIPTQYGGKLAFAWNDRPHLDDTITGAVAWENGHTAFPPGPLYWVPVDGGKQLQCVARGSVGGQERREVVGSIPVAVAPEEEEAEGGEEGQTKQTENVAQPVVNGNGNANTNGIGGAVVASGEEAEVASPVTEKFVDAPEVPLASPVPGLQELSLDAAPNEKAVQVTEVVPNGKPVATA